MFPRSSWSIRNRRLRYNANCTMPLKNVLLPEILNGSLCYVREFYSVVFIIFVQSYDCFVEPEYQSNVCLAVCEQFTRTAGRRVDEAIRQSSLHQMTQITNITRVRNHNIDKMRFRKLDNCVEHRKLCLAIPCVFRVVFIKGMRREES